MLGENGLEQLLKATIDCAVQSKAIAHPVDSRLLEIARHKVVSAAKQAGLSLKQTPMPRKARRCGARQAATLTPSSSSACARPSSASARAQQPQGCQRPGDVATTRPAHPHPAAQHQEQALGPARPRARVHLEGQEARNPYEFGVKVSLAVTHKQGLMVGARSFPGNPYDGHVLSAQLEQTANPMQDLGRSPKQVIVDLGYRGVEADNPGVQLIHRGKYKSLTDHEKRLLKRRQAIEPLIDHTKADHRMERCWLQGALGDALHALSCAAGYNIRWLLRAIARLGLAGLLCALSALAVYVARMLRATLVAAKTTTPDAAQAPAGLLVLTTSQHLAVR